MRVVVREATSGPVRDNFPGFGLTERLDREIVSGVGARLALESSDTQSLDTPGVVVFTKEKDRKRVRIHRNGELWEEERELVNTVGKFDD